MEDACRVRRRRERISSFQLSLTTMKQQNWRFAVYKRDLEHSAVHRKKILTE
jgi:hypothetical protein